MTNDLYIIMIPPFGINPRRHSPMMASQNNSTSTRLRALLDEICTLNALLFISRLQLLRKIVVTNGTRVHDRVGREDVLAPLSPHISDNVFIADHETHRSSSSSILCRTSSDICHLVILDNLIVSNPSISQSIL